MLVRQQRQPLCDETGPPLASNSDDSPIPEPSVVVVVASQAALDIKDQTFAVRKLMPVEAGYVAINRSKVKGPKQIRDEK